MNKIKVLYDYRPAMREQKNGIPIFVKNIYENLIKNRQLLVKKSGIIPYYFPGKILFPFRFIYFSLFVPFRMYVGRYDIYIENKYIYRPVFKYGKTKIVTVVHDIGTILFDDIQTKRFTKYMRKNLPIGIKNSDLIITVSQTSKRDIEKYLEQIGVYRPVEVVYNAPQIVDYSDSPVDVFSRFGISSDFVLYLGTLEPRKNPLQMIKGFHRFLQDYQEDIQFVFAGQKGWLYDDVLEYIKKNDLHHHIVFTNYVSEQEKYWLIKEAKGFIFLSKYEGFGIPPLESLMIGTPVLLSDIPVFRELFEGDALYVDAEDEYEVAEGISELIHTPQNKQYRSLEKFSWEKSAKDLSTYIQDMLSR